MQPMHLIVILVIGIAVFWPGQLGELGKGLGDGIRHFKNAMKEGSEPAAPSAAPEKPPGTEIRTAGNTFFPRQERPVLTGGAGLWFSVVMDRGYFSCRRRRYVGNLAGPSVPERIFKTPLFFTLVSDSGPARAACMAQTTWRRPIPEEAMDASSGRTRDKP